MGNRDLHISGAGSYPGGLFDNVSISGAGKITGDIKCIRFSGSGSAKVEGNVVCDSFSCSGTGKVIGNVESKFLKVSGVCKIQGNMKGGTISISGATTIEGDIKCEKVSSSGMLSAHGNIDAEEIRIDGGIKNEGIINAEKVIIECRAGNGSCIFNEIGASKVSINGYNEDSRPRFYNLFGLFTGNTGSVTGNVVEGDEIYIENAKVKTVRGERITIGPNCEIEYVEYRESLQVSDQSSVKETVRL